MGVNDVQISALKFEALLALVAGQASFGRALYVDPDNGSDTDARDGLTPDGAFQTIDHAHTWAESGKGDRIRLMPGTYDENVVITKDYVTLEGIISGYGKPDITPAAGIAVRIHAQGVKLRHLRPVSADVAAVQIQGNGFELFDVWAEGATDGMTLKPDKDDDSYSASEGRIIRCVLRNSGVGMRFYNPGPGIEGGVGPTDVVVEKCLFYSNTNQDIRDQDTGGSNDKTFLNSQILKCTFLDDKHGSPYLTLTGGSVNTGQVSGCFFGDKTGATATELALAAAIVAVGNYDANGLIDASGF
jgi:hypothetical protein